MTFGELVSGTTWAEVKAALLWLYPEEHAQLAGYRKVFWELRKLVPESDPMRIAVERREVPGGSDELVPEVIGRNGTLNCELEDFKHLGEHATREYGDQEAIYSMSLSPWRNWLGMSVEPTTLQQCAAPQIVAHCLSDMTFHGFSEADHRAVREELRKRVEEFDAMTPEEQERDLVPADEVFARMRERYGVDE